MGPGLISGLRNYLSHWRLVLRHVKKTMQYLSTRILNGRVACTQNISKSQWQEYLTFLLHFHSCHLHHYLITSWWDCVCLCVCVYISISLSHRTLCNLKGKNCLSILRLSQQLPSIYPVPALTWHSKNRYSRSWTTPRIRDPGTPMQSKIHI